ncbi:hypothetical protein CDD80_1353 [Ophiocordyceps camponoti-rufipedis]|uniref:Uncharacterized protein n=1 Tax=Ophiocordyceps camponoti-rufipedis TaxID=2004952 RepID=A0A2C5XH43_9HYPO|nr:hypothetical protein CDD80_1353 [Ophiocordyceps camponoti-rufipedis]
MSVLVKGLAFDWEGSDKAITGIWPAVAIESAATQQTTTANPAEKRNLRKPDIFSDAILSILNAPPSLVNGQLLLDEDFLRQHASVSDFSRYSLVPGAVPRRIMPRILPDLSVAEQADEGKHYSGVTKPKL